MHTLLKLETSKSDFGNFCTFGLENYSLIWFLLPSFYKRGMQKTNVYFPAFDQKQINGHLYYSNSNEKVLSKYENIRNKN